MTFGGEARNAIDKLGVTGSSPVPPIGKGPLERAFSRKGGAFMVLLSSAPSEQPLFGGMSVKSAAATRIAFTEIADRWIPTDLIDAVVWELGIRDEPGLHLVR